MIFKHRISYYDINVLDLLIYFQFKTHKISQHQRIQPASEQRRLLDLSDSEQREADCEAKSCCLSEELRCFADVLDCLPRELPKR